MGAPTAEPELRRIPISEIQPADDNFRGPVADEDVAELTELVRAQGILQPLTVVRKEGGGYKLVFGHRRLRAAALAGLTEVPAQVKQYDDAERLAVMLTENLGRADLSPIQEARAFLRMLQLEDNGKPRYTQRTLATALGVGQAKVSNYTSIFKLTDDVIAQLDSGGITLTQAIQLARLAKYPDRVQAALVHFRRFGGDMELAVRRQQDELEREQARAKKLKELKRTGVRIAPDDWLNAGGRMLGPGFPVPIEPEEHAIEPCHAVTVNTAGTVIYVCMEPERHRPAPPAAAETPDGVQAGVGERPALSVVPGPREMTPEEKAAEEARRKEEAARQAAALARKQALEAAGEARMLQLKTLLAGRLGRSAEPTRTFVNWFLLTLVDDIDDNSFACQALGLEPPAEADVEATEEAAGLVLAFAGKNADAVQRAAAAVACQVAEEQLDGEYPNFKSPIVRLYYDYLLKTGGYELSDVEREELLAAGFELPEAAPEPAGEEVTA